VLVLADARALTPRRPATSRENPAGAGLSYGVSDGTRTRDRLDHNQELYLLSYAHQDGPLVRRPTNLAVADCPAISLPSALSASTSDQSM
jgi:hypothetical protein